MFLFKPFMKKYFFMAVATLVVSAAAVVGAKAYNYYSMPELMKANLEALSQIESSPYDVPDHYLDYEQKTADVTVSGTHQIVLEGKIFDLKMATPGAQIRVSYLLGHCLNEQEKATCPFNKIGDIKLISPNF